MLSIFFPALFKRISHLLILLLLFAAFPGTPVYAEDQISAEMRYLYVQPGQTLYNIVSRLYPDRQKDWPKLQQQIFRENPHAFIDGDPTRIKVGVRLDLPKRMVVKPRPIAKAPSHVGEVILARGETIAVGSNNLSRKLGVGDGVFVGDKIITGETGFLRLQMIDNALLDLRCYSTMVIEKYELQSAKRSSILNLLQGSVRKVSGDIGKRTEDVYELKTPVATIGVRGTEYAIRVSQSRGCDGSIDTDDDGLYVKVIDGLVDVHNKAASTNVAKDDSLYIPLPDKAPEDKAIQPGVLEPVKEVSEEESGTSWWWALLGVIIIALAI